MDLTKYSKGKRMVREDLIKEIGENKADLEEIKKVLPKKVNSYIVENITSISGEILSKMKAGDIVLKKTGEQYHSYIVSFKKDDEGICLTYTDASIVETVSYDLVGTTWTYNSTDVTPIGEYVKVVANPDLEGTEPQLEGLEVGGTKYAMPTGMDLYEHNCYFTIYGQSFNVVVTNTMSTPITKQFLQDNNKYIQSACLGCVSIYGDTNRTIGAVAPISNGTLSFKFYNSLGVLDSNWTTDVAYSIDDRVTKL